MSELNNSASATTLRSLVVGTVLCAAIGAGATYGSNVIGGSMLAANFTTGAGFPGAKYAFEFASQAINSPVDPHPGGWIFKGIGAALMSFLMIARRRYLWWPLHPLGFPISVLGYPVLTVWISVFIAWLSKLIILKYGGPRLFTKVRPFFLGLIAGQFVVMGVWLIIDHFTGMKGNQLGLT